MSKPEFQIDGYHQGVLIFSITENSTPVECQQISELKNQLVRYSLEHNDQTEAKKKLLDLLHTGRFPGSVFRISCQTQIPELTAKHWAVLAILDLSEMVDKVPIEDGHCGRQHLLYMINHVKENHVAMSATKINRWLGWIQCALYSAGVMDLEQAKLHNLKWSDDG